MSFTSKIRELRKERGITQQQAAELFGVSWSAYQKYERENNSVMPSLGVIIKMANEFHVSLDYLLGLSECKTHDDTANAIKMLYEKLLSGLSSIPEPEKLDKLKAMCDLLDSK